MRNVAVVAVLVWVGFVVVGCEEKDPYADAPTAQAEEASKQERESGASQGELPPGHPPIRGNTQKMKRARPPSGGSAESAAGGGAPHEKGPLRWSVPKQWTSVQPSTRMRLAEYRLPATESSNPATLAVFHFGQQGGGDVQSNIERWKGQFSAPDGGSAEAEVTEQTLSGGALTVHRVDVSGTYDPGVGMGGGKEQEGQRMLAAIVESPDGLYFFKLVGPKATVSAGEEQFDALVESLAVAGD